MLKSKISSKLFYDLIEISTTILQFNGAADKLLSEFFRLKRKLRSNERELIITVVYAILRNYYKLSTTLNLPTIITQKKDIANIIGLCLIKLLDYPGKDLIAIKMLNITELNQLILAHDRQSVVELPNWLFDTLATQYSQEEVTQLAMSLQETAAVDLRVNLLKTDRETVLGTLRDENAIAASKTEFSPFGIRLLQRTPITKHQLFLNGSIEIQDESSQLAGLLLKPRRGEMIVDFCAGSGGKTLLLGMLMHNTGRIYAFDIHDKRLNNLTPRLSRSGLSNIYPQLIASVTDNKIKRLSGKIDRVLVDVPCSGLGTLRRNPELRLRHTLSTIQELNIKQLEILTAASKLLKPGGQLVYATCSILTLENQDIVAKFLQANPQFKHVAAATILGDLQIPNVSDDLVLLPHIHDTDGFFASRIERTA